MFRTALRTLPRRARPYRLPAPGSRARHLSTAPPHETSRSWKNSAARWGIAIAGVYYYNTSTLFAEEPPALVQAAANAEESLPTLDSLSPSRRRQDAHDASAQSAPLAAATPSLAAGTEPQTAAELEDDAHSQGAFNEETGEINWDCPCLGGMAHGPCGEEFRAAFSCFVFSKEEPKGMDCIDKFKGMQGCFREHPDVYGAELDDEDDEELEQEAGAVSGSEPVDAPGVAAAVAEKTHETKERVADAAAEKTRETKERITDAVKAQAPSAQPATSAKASPAMSSAPAEDAEPAPSRLLKQPGVDKVGPVDEAEGDLIPKAAHDATDANTGSLAKQTEK